MSLYQPDQKILNDKYQIVKLLGAGAFGEVYLVNHLELGVPRAIKVAHREMPGFASTLFQEAFDRFRQEAQIGARIKDDHIIQVHDFENGEDSLHLIMEYAPGGSLEDRLQDKLAHDQLFRVEEALTICKNISAGLAILHNQRNPIVHRDLKPSNILFGEGEVIKIADLGLAQVPGGMSSRSRLGSLAQPHPGTQAYMSPEQETSFAMLRPGSDIYALGLILFEMLTGMNYKMQRPGTKINDFISDVDSNVADLLDQLLAEDIKFRIWDGRDAFDKFSLLSTGHQNQKSQRQEVDVQKLIEVKEQSENNEPKLPLEINKSINLNRKEEHEIENQKNPPKKKTTQKKTNPNPYPERLIELGEKTTISFVNVPAGVFMMGAGENDSEAVDDEKPQHEVYLDGYWIGKYPVTNDQYFQYLKATGNYGPNHWIDNKIPKGKEKHPIVNISWYKAVDFTKWLSKKAKLNIGLSTEAQWEKAARGTDRRKYPWGNKLPTFNHANYGKWLSDTTQVNAFELNQSPYGCCDMVGNVWEWVMDWFDENYFASQNNWKDPMGPSKGILRVLRGGSWDFYERNIRVTRRLGYLPDRSFSNCGFRCVLYE